MRKTLILVLSLAAFVSTFTAANASHPPGERTWQSIVNGGDCTVDPKCELYGVGGSCLKHER